MFTPIFSNDRVHLPIYVYGAKRYPSQKYEKYPSGSARFMQISYFYKGHGIFIDHNNTTYELNKGDCFYFFPKTSVEYYPICGDWGTCYILCGGSALEEIGSKLNFAKSGVIRSSAQGFEHIGQMIEDMVDCDDSTSVFSYADMSYKLYALFISISECIMEQIKDYDASKAKLAPLIALLHNRYYDDLSLEEMANTVGYNSTYVEKMFRSVYNTSLKNYLITIRIDNARKLLLKEPMTPIKNIALRCGFRDNSYFGKMFKRFSGLTPMQYRENHKYEFDGE